MRYSAGVILILGLVLAGCGARLQESGPHGDQNLTPALNENVFTTRDGTTLPVRYFGGKEKPVAVILALHGFNDYSRGFEDAGKALAEKNIAVYAYDQRGFGATKQRGIWAGSDRLADDAIAFAATLRALYPGTPLYLMGHSMGGAVTILAATHDQPKLDVAKLNVDGVILVAPAIWGGAAISGFERGTLDTATYMMPWLPVGPPHDRHRLATDNMDALREMSADPLVIKVNRLDAVQGLVALMDQAVAASPKLQTPSLILFGSEEQVLPQGPVRSFLNSLPAASAASRQVALYPKGYHMLLRDKAADVVIQDIAAWIKNPNQPLPSGADARAKAAFTGKN